MVGCFGAGVHVNAKTLIPDLVTAGRSLYVLDRLLKSDIFDSEIKTASGLVSAQALKTSSCLTRLSAALIPENHIVLLGEGVYRYLCAATLTHIPDMGLEK